MQAVWCYRSSCDKNMCKSNNQISWASQKPSLLFCGQSSQQLGFTYMPGCWISIPTRSLCFSHFKQQDTSRRSLGTLCQLRCHLTKLPWWLILLGVPNTLWYHGYHVLAVVIIGTAFNQMAALAGDRNHYIDAAYYYMRRCVVMVTADSIVVS